MAQVTTTGGRPPRGPPRLPVVYEEAVKALAACRSLDEAKYWDNKADALAAWAKIYRDKSAEREARALKLWAYRRIGELAAELRPQAKIGGRLLAGPRSILIEHGFSENQASAARRLARGDKQHFEQLVSLPRPPSPVSVSHRFKGIHFKTAPYRCAPGPWAAHEEWSRTWSALTIAAAAVKKVSARELSRAVNKANAEAIRERVLALNAWLDEFEQHLPK